MELQQQPSVTTRASAAGVGKSVKRDALKAGSEAASEALRGLKGSRPSLILVFGTTGYDQQQLLKGVAEVTGDTPLSGCSGEGVITQHGADESGHAVTVVAIASSRARFKTFLVTNAARDPRAAARELAGNIRQTPLDDAKLLLLFPDGVSVDCGSFLDELRQGLPAHLPAAGGASGGMMGKKASETGTFEYHNGQVHKESVSAVLVSGDLLPEISVSHGCRPIGLPRTITKAEGAYMHQIDGRPALEVFNDYLGEDPELLRTVDMVHLCACIPLPGDPAPDLSKHVVRAPLGHDVEQGWLFFPGGGFDAGTPVQLARRDAEQIRESAQASANAISARHPGKRPFLVLHFDCAGRGVTLFGDSQTTTEFTTDPLQNSLGKDLPWIGFHTFGEIAPVNQGIYYHNYSVVLCALYEAA